MHLAVLDEEDVRARALGHISAVIHEERVRAALGLCRVFRRCANHVETRRLGMHRGRFGRRALPLGDVDLGALVLGVAIITAPFPRCDSQMHRVARRGDAHVLTCAAPRHRTHIRIRQAIGSQDLLLGRFDLIDRVGDLKVQLSGGKVQPLRMFTAQENLAVIRPLTLENRAGIMHCMGQDVHVGAAPVDHLAVHPDFPVKIIISSHASLPISKNCANKSDVDIKLRKTCDSIALRSWNVNKADIN